MLYNLSAEMAEAGTGGSLRFTIQLPWLLVGYRPMRELYPKTREMVPKEKPPRLSSGLHWHMYT